MQAMPDKGVQIKQPRPQSNFSKTVVIPSSLILSVKNRGGVGCGLLNWQNLLSVTYVICRPALSR